MRSAPRSPWRRLVSVVLSVVVLWGAALASQADDDALLVGPPVSHDDMAHVLALDRDADSGDVIAHVKGRGRARSDGISITRAMRRDDQGNYISDDATTTQDRSVVFTPAELDVAHVRACEPTRLVVRVESRSALPLRISDVRFESDELLLASDPRGVVLDPGESVEVNLVVVVGNAQPFSSYVFFVTSVGEFAVPVRGHTQPSPYGLRGLQLSVPVGMHLEHTIQLHNPHDKVLRVSEIFSLDQLGNILLPNEHPRPTERTPFVSVASAAAHTQAPHNASTVWEIPPLETRPVARFAFTANSSTGRYHAIVRVATTATQFFVPMTVDVRSNQFIIESSDIDIGVFTSHEEPRRLLLSFHNTGLQHVSVFRIYLGTFDREDITSDRPEGAHVIPMQSASLIEMDLSWRFYNSTNQPGPRTIQLEIHSNATSSDTSHTVLVRAFVMRGHLSYSLAQTTFRLVSPTTIDSGHVIGDAVELNSEISRLLVLKNDFNIALDVERISVPESCGEFEVQDFDSGVVKPSSPFPPIHLRVRPNSTHSIATRVCWLHVQTNASVHRVPLVLHSGLLSFTSSRNTSERASISDSCDLDVHDNSADREDFVEHVLPPLLGAKLCRRVVMDLGRVSKHAIIEDVINITNVNPTVVRPQVRLARDIAKNRTQRLEVNTTTFVHTDPGVAVDLAAFKFAWEQWLPNEPLSNTSHPITLAPGHILSIRTRIKVISKKIGVYLESAMKIETELETIFLFIRYETVRGAIRPDAHTIDVYNIHPGQAGVVNVKFISTMRHDVVTRDLELSTGESNDRPAALGIWNMPTVFRANSSTQVTLFLFPPEFYSSCKQGRFYAECFITDSTARSPSATTLSEFGGLVTKSDLERLATREREWTFPSSVHGDSLGARVGIIATLKTDAQRVRPVRITLYLVRPQFFRNGGSDQAIIFPLTEVLQQYAAYITVTNPSDFEVDMELAIAEKDRDLFYACDDDLSQEECLREWEDISREQVELAWKSTADACDSNAHRSDVAPLFFRPRLVHMLPGDQVELGPVYFYPSTIGSWQTHVYIRNDLTHIEPVTITAHSGLGELSITSPQSTDKKQRTSPSDSGTEGDINFLVNGGGGSDAFHVSQSVMFRNSGSFKLMFSAHLTNVTFNAFRIVSEHGNISRYSNGSQQLKGVVLDPNETVSVEVHFSPDCIHSDFSGILVIVTRDGATRYPVYGAMTRSAVSKCRRQLIFDRASGLVTCAWMLTVAVATVTIVTALWRLVSVSVTRQSPRKQLCAEVSRKQNPQAINCAEDITGQDEANEMAALMRSLEDMERTFALKSAPVATVTTPHVAELLASRASRAQKVEQTGNMSPPPNPIPGNALIGAGHSEPVSSLESERQPNRLESVVATTNGTPNRPGSQPPNHQSNATNNQLCEDLVVLKGSARSTRGKHAQVDGSPLQGEDTASEEEEMEEEGNQEEDVNNQVDAGTEGATSCAVEEVEDEENVVQESELLLLNLEEPFVSISDLRLDDPLHRDQELRMKLNFDDDWSALSFDSLSSEIGKLVSDDRSTFDRSTPRSLSTHPKRSAIEHDLGLSGPLAVLSMAPPRFPMSSLFAPSRGTPLPSSLPKATKPAPPGFTAADANPGASRVAFERLRGHNSLEPSGPSLQAFVPRATDDAVTPPLEAAFSARYALFGPALGGSPLSATVSAGAAVTNGRIGSARPAKETSVVKRLAPSATAQEEPKP